MFGKATLNEEDFVNLFLSCLVITGSALNNSESWGHLNEIVSLNYRFVIVRQ